MSLVGNLVNSLRSVASLTVQFDRVIRGLALRVDRLALQKGEGEDEGLIRPSTPNNQGFGSPLCGFIDNSARVPTVSAPAAVRRYETHLSAIETNT